MLHNDFRHFDGLSTFQQHFNKTFNSIFCFFFYDLSLSFSTFQLFHYLYYYSYNKLILYRACARARYRACARARIRLSDRLNSVIHGFFRWQKPSTYLIGTGLGDTMTLLKCPFLLHLLLDHPFFCFTLFCEVCVFIL